MKHTQARQGDAPIVVIAGALFVALILGAGAFGYARYSALRRRAVDAMRAEEMARMRAEEAKAAAQRANANPATQPSPVPAWVVAIHKGDAELARSEYSHARSLYEEGMVDAGTPTDEGTRAIVHDAYVALARVMSMMSTGRTSPSCDARELTPQEAEEYRSTAFAMLERARDLGWKDRAAAEAEKDFEPISKDPRWQKLLDTLGH